MASAEGQVGFEWPNTDDSFEPIRNIAAPPSVGVETFADPPALPKKRNAPGKNERSMARLQEKCQRLEDDLLKIQLRMEAKVDQCSWYKTFSIAITLLVVVLGATLYVHADSGKQLPIDDYDHLSQLRIVVESYEARLLSLESAISRHSCPGYGRSELLAALVFLGLAAATIGPATTFIARAKCMQKASEYLARLSPKHGHGRQVLTNTIGVLPVKQTFFEFPLGSIRLEAAYEMQDYLDYDGRRQTIKFAIGAAQARKEFLANRAESFSGLHVEVDSENWRGEVFSYSSPLRSRLRRKLKTLLNKNNNILITKVLTKCCLLKLD